MTDIATLIRERLAGQPEAAFAPGQLRDTLITVVDFCSEPDAPPEADFLAGCILFAVAHGLHLSHSPAEAGSQPMAAAGETDWRRVAVKLARTRGEFYRLTTPERDALEAAIEEAAAIDEDQRLVDTADAADREPHA